MSDKFERFGKYLILDHLVDGGMAKICRARFLGEQANKVVAIKMVQAQYSKDPSFVQMFEDELKVTFGLLHPNIVQMTDYGMVNGQLYSAMEYVDGANLKQFLDRLKQKNFVFPVEISTYIIAQVCQGLHYAHTFTDKLTGKPFNIIHRDISPHNIMLTYDGAVKVIDFGIAKADSNSEATQAGTIKGKLSYLAPEYLDGLELDVRYDLFAVGITLWEMLCCRKLFSAPNDLAVLKQIQACKVPRPSSINPNVPKELDAIVLKALSKDRNNRYENMDQFNRALVKFLYSHYPDFNATDLKYFAGQLFKDEIEKDKKKFVEFGKIDITTYLNDLKNDGPSTSVSTQSSADRTQKSRVLEFKVDESNKLDLDTSLPDTPKAAKKKEMTPSERKRTRTTKVRKQTVRTQVRREPVKKKGSSSVFVAGFIMLIAAGAYLKQDLIKEMIGFSEGGRSIAKQHDQKLEELGRVSLSNYDSTMNVYVNDKKVSVKGISIEVPLNIDVEIRVQKSGFSDYKTTVFLSDEQSFERVVIPTLGEQKIGILSTSENFSSGSKLVFQVDGKQVEKKLPFENFRIPAGSYRAKIENPLLGTQRKIKFEIEEDKKFYLE